MLSGDEKEENFGHKYKNVAQALFLPHGKCLNLEALKTPFKKLFSCGIPGKALSTGNM
jgi:hypothetical protein